MRTLPEPYRWTRQEYGRLGECGFFQSQRVELIRGRIVAMSPVEPRHSAVNGMARRALQGVIPQDRAFVRTRDPLALGEWDEPEPDLVVAVGRVRDYLEAHPTASQTLLVVEVADSSLAYDRGDKADVYAAAGIDDYWIISLPERIVEVCRRPSPDPASETGVRYAERRRVAPGESVAPLAAPDRPIPVADLLP